MKARRQTATNVAPRPNLREAQKAMTRQRIIDAAREVFSREGYYAATIDQIVAEARASRPTFYLHFSDKEQILAHLAADYSAHVAAALERLPAPRPTVAQLREWLIEVIATMERQRADFAAISEVNSHAHHEGAQSYFTIASEDWLRVLASRAPPFAFAFSSRSREAAASAQARLLVLEISWASVMNWMFRGTELAGACLTLVAQKLHDFIHDRRLQHPAPALRKAAEDRVGIPKVQKSRRKKR